MKTYGFLHSILIVNTVPISGFDEGDDVVSAARNAPSGGHKIGVDGELTHRISADRSGILTFRLMQSSASNQFLGGIVAAAENNVFVPVAFTYRDTLTGDLVNGTQGYIPGYAEMVRGNDPQAQEWTIITERADFFYGTGGSL